MFARLGAAASGLSYIQVVGAAAWLATGGVSEVQDLDSVMRGKTSGLQLPLGVALVAAAGAILIMLALWQLQYGPLSRPARPERRVVGAAALDLKLGPGRSGRAWRGALLKLALQPLGPVWLALVAVGLMCYGLLDLSEAAIDVCAAPSGSRLARIVHRQGLRLNGEPFSAWRALDVPVQSGPCRRRKGNTMTAAGLRGVALDVRGLNQPAVLIYNPHAGRKLGVSTNSGGPAQAQQALRAAGIPFVARPTERPGHATELARAAVAEGRTLVIAAGGDGTVGETAQALVQTDTVLGILPLGSVMNTARALCIPHNLDGAAQVIGEGRVRAMDLGLAHGRYFLEAAGIGLDAGLFGYFARLDSDGLRLGVLRATLRFLRGLGEPPLLLEIDGETIQVRASMVTIANAPFEGAAYDIAPEARLDDGYLHLVIFRGAGVIRMLVYLAEVARGRRWAAPPRTERRRARSVRISHVLRRPLPMHIDGIPVGGTPATFEAIPAGLKVLAGQPGPRGVNLWGEPMSAR